MLFYVVKYSFLVLWLVKLQTGTKLLYLLQSNLLPQVLRHFYTKNVVQYSMGYLSSDLGPQFCSLCIYFLIVYRLLQSGSKGLQCSQALPLTWALQLFGCPTATFPVRMNKNQRSKVKLESKGVIIEILRSCIPCRVHKKEGLCSKAVTHLWLGMFFYQD